MAQDLAILEQFGYRAFDSGVTVAVAGHAQTQDRIENRARRRDEAGADARSEQVRQRSDVDHVCGTGSRGDGRDRSSLVVILVIVVILNDRESVPQGQVSKLVAPRLRQHGPGRKLVMRNQENGANRLLHDEGLQGLDVQAIAINRQR